MLLDACTREWMVQNSCFFAVSVPLAKTKTFIFWYCSCGSSAKRFWQEPLLWPKLPLRAIICHGVSRPMVYLWTSTRSFWSSSAVQGRLLTEVRPWKRVSNR